MKRSKQLCLPRPFIRSGVSEPQPAITGWSCSCQSLIDRCNIAIRFCIGICWLLQSLLHSKAMLLFGLPICLSRCYAQHATWCIALYICCTPNHCRRAFHKLWQRVFDTACSVLQLQPTFSLPSAHTLNSDLCALHRDCCCLADVHSR